MLSLLLKLTLLLILVLLMLDFLLRMILILMFLMMLINLGWVACHLAQVLRQEKIYQWVLDEFSKTISTECW